MGSEAEKQVVFTLRMLVLAIAAVGVTAGLVGTNMLRLYAIGFFAPIGWVYWRPRMPQILVWIMWSTTLSMLAVIVALGEGGLFQRNGHWLMLVCGVMVTVVLPLVRRLNRSPALPRPTRLPEARVRSPR
jgi:hypothetical protein